jgi:Protein of unknown function (DUF3553)
MRFVRHSTMPVWGLGVVAGEDGSNVDVIFEGGGRRKLNKSFAGLVEIADVGVPADHPLRVLDDWPKIERDGKRAVAKRELPKGFDPFIKEFLNAFPGGLRSSECDDQERTYKIEASELARKELSPPVLEALLARGEYAEIMLRARRSLAKANLVFPNELTKFGEIPASAHKNVAERLVRLVNAGKRTPVALEDLATALKPYEAAKWTIVSLLPFLLDPEHWPFVKPTFIQRAEKAMHIDVEYQPRPNARTYELVRDLYAQVASLLAERGQPPRDFIDVQTFLWVASGMRREMHEIPGERAPKHVA